MRLEDTASQTLLVVHAIVAQLAADIDKPDADVDLDRLRRRIFLLLDLLHDFD